jgi:hypothetical protein
LWAQQQKTFIAAQLILPGPVWRPALQAFSHFLAKSAGCLTLLVKSGKIPL